MDTLYNLLQPIIHYDGWHHAIPPPVSQSLATSLKTLLPKFEKNTFGFPQLLSKNWQTISKTSFWIIFQNWKVCLWLSYCLPFNELTKNKVM